MKNILDEITSLELYLAFPAKKVIKTKKIKDNTAGLNPCYYMIDGDYLKVSTSVFSLIVDSGKFILNPEFKPDFQNREFTSIEGKSYNKKDTVDKRIFRLQSFETRTPKDSTIKFNPTRELTDIEIFTSLCAHYLKKFVNDIEKKFPEHEHVVFTGGKDSQMILLIPKLNYKKWHVFSSRPNAHLVKIWFSNNKIDYMNFFEHTNENDDDEKILMKKIMNSDCISNPEHMRWFRATEKIADFFDGKCILWSGLGGGELVSVGHNYFYRDDYRHFFDSIFSVCGSWQGNSLQTLFNMTGCPSLSPYSSEELWRNVYEKYNPKITKYEDVRNRIGEKIANRKIEWLKINPAPDPWLLDEKTKDKFLAGYIKNIKKAINEK